MNETHIKKLEGYMEDMQLLVQTNQQTLQDHKLHVHSNAMVQALERCLATQELQIETKMKREPTILPYEALDPLLAAYDATLEQHETMLRKAHYDIDVLSDMIECLLSENKKLFTELIHSKTNHKAFTVQQSKLIRRIYNKTTYRL